MKLLYVTILINRSENFNSYYKDTNVENLVVLDTDDRILP